MSKIHYAEVSPEIEALGIIQRSRVAEARNFALWSNGLVGQYFQDDILYELLEPPVDKTLTFRMMPNLVLNCRGATGELTRLYLRVTLRTEFKPQPRKARWVFTDDKLPAFEERVVADLQAFLQLPWMLERYGALTCLSFTGPARNFRKSVTHLEAYGHHSSVKILPTITPKRRQLFERSEDGGEGVEIDQSTLRFPNTLTLPLLWGRVHFATSLPKTRAAWHAGGNLRSSFVLDGVPADLPRNYTGEFLRWDNTAVSVKDGFFLRGGPLVEGRLELMRTPQVFGFWHWCAEVNLLDWTTLAYLEMVMRVELNLSFPFISACDGLPAMHFDTP